MYVALPIYSFSDSLGQFTTSDCLIYYQYSVDDALRLAEKLF